MTELKNLLIYMSVFVAMTLINVITDAIRTHKSNKKTPLEALKDKLPDYIEDAEHRGFMNGEKKKDYVISLAITFLADKLRQSWEDTYKKYASTVSYEIEKLLKITQASIYKGEN